MKKVCFLILMSLFSVFSAQKKDTCKDIMNRWNGWEIYKKPSIESVKKCLSKDERKIKIEVVNDGDYKDLHQILYLKFDKVNNKDFSPILKHSENTPNIVIDKFGEEEWGNYGGGLLDNSTTIYQAYVGVEDIPNIPLKELEIYETTAPVLSGVFKIFGTYRNDYDYSKPTNLTKTIRIYSNGNLLLERVYSFDELEKIDGITLEFSAINK